MDDFSAFTPGERALLDSLNRHGVRFMLVGASAAVLQGANTATQDIDLWFESLTLPALSDAVREAHGIWVSGTFGMRPPQIGGDTVGDRFDVVTHMHGLGAFDEEWGNTCEITVDGIPLRVLKLFALGESFSQSPNHPAPSKSRPPHGPGDMTSGRRSNGDRRDRRARAGNTAGRAREAARRETRPG